MTTKIEYGLPTGEGFVNPKKKMPIEIRPGGSKTFSLEGSLIGSMFGRETYDVTVQTSKNDNGAIVYIEKGYGVGKCFTETERIILPENGEVSRVHSRGQKVIGAFKVKHVKDIYGTKR
jgi:hypothetical protein